MHAFAHSAATDHHPPPPLRSAHYHTHNHRSQFKQGKSAQGVADSLVDIALKRYTTDNVAVIVADMKGGKEAWTAKPKAAPRKGLLSGLFGGGGNGAKK
jgi:hypothetical protein